MEDYRKKIFDEHIAYVEDFASKYVDLGLSYDELISIAYEVLFVFVERYQYFDSFSRRRFLHSLKINLYTSISRAIIKANCMCTFYDDKYYSDIMKILKAYRSGYDCLEDIQEMTSLDLDRIKECTSFIKRNMIPIDKCIFVVSGDFQDNVMNRIFASSIFDYVLKCNFHDIEKELIKLRYGFYGRIYSISECSKILGKKHQYISHIEKNIIKKIRMRLIADGLINESDVKIEKEYIRKFFA